jgi:glycosyltransferase involved in cell wall biosynthesis
MISRTTPVVDPAISVCVIMFMDRDYLIRSLQSLMKQDGGDGIEVIVPFDDTLRDVDGLRARFPAVRFLGADGRRTPAQLRAIGVTAARGPIVALLEDHCVPDADWAARLIAAHRSTHAAIGGSVEKGIPTGRKDDSPLNWAVYLTDYSRYMRPMPAGPAVSLTDCNVSYKRDELAAIEPSWHEEFHENVVNGLLRERGKTLWFDPDVIVREQRSLTLRSALKDRYAFGRLFASTRVADAPASRRAMFAAGSVLLPPVLVARAARNLIARGRHQKQIPRTLPALLFVTSAWMLGELVGYVTGTPEETLTAAPEPTFESAGRQAR